MLFDLFKPKKSLLNEDDSKELMDIKRKAYMEEARKIMYEKGKLEANNDLLPKKKVSYG